MSTSSSRTSGLRRSQRKQTRTNARIFPATPTQPTPILKHHNHNIKNKGKIKASAAKKVRFVESVKDSGNDKNKNYQTRNRLSRPTQSSLNKQKLGVNTPKPTPKRSRNVSKGNNEKSLTLHKSKQNDSNRTKSSINSSKNNSASAVKSNPFRRMAQTRTRRRSNEAITKKILKAVASDTKDKASNGETAERQNNREKKEKNDSKNNSTIGSNKKNNGLTLSTNDKQNENSSENESDSDIDFNIGPIPFGSSLSIDWNRKSTASTAKKSNKKRKYKSLSNGNDVIESNENASEIMMNRDDTESDGIESIAGNIIDDNRNGSEKESDIDNNDDDIGAPPTKRRKLNANRKSKSKSKSKCKSLELTSVKDDNNKNENESKNEKRSGKGRVGQTRVGSANDSARMYIETANAMHEIAKVCSAFGFDNDSNSNNNNNNNNDNDSNNGMETPPTRPLSGLEFLFLFFLFSVFVF